MQIKHCRICGAEFDCRGARNAKTCILHRKTSAVLQREYVERRKNGKKCTWCGTWSDAGREFCKPECEMEATRYRAFLKRNAA